MSIPSSFFATNKMDDSVSRELAIMTRFPTGVVEPYQTIIIHNIICEVSCIPCLIRCGIFLTGSYEKKTNKFYKCILLDESVSIIPYYPQ